MQQTRILKLKAKGFTLIEVMVVIVIIGIIAGFGIPNYALAVLKGRESNAIVQLTTLHGAAVFYKAQAGDYWVANTSDLSNINDNLSTNVVANDLTYTYVSAAGSDAFEVTAQWDDNNDTRDFTVKFTEAAIEDGVNPCCDAGNCPSLPDC